MATSAPAFTPEQVAMLLAQAVNVESGNPDAHLKTNDFDGHTNRRYFVTLRGSLRDLQRGDAEATWHADTGCEHIYQRIAGVHEETKETVFDGDVTKGVIMDMKLETLSSNFPVDIGAIITGVHGKTFTRNGKNYAFIAEAGKVYEPTYSIFDPVSPVTRAALDQYNDTAMADLDRNITPLLTDGHKLVNNQCPIATMLRMNAHPQALNITHFDHQEGQPGWLRIKAPLVDRCVATYKAQCNIPWIDFSKFRVDFERVGAETWDEPIGVIDNIRRRAKEEGTHVSDARLENIYTLKALLTVDSVLYGPAKTHVIASLSSQ